jgi:hypothetical protein
MDCEIKRRCDEGVRVRNQSQRTGNRSGKRFFGEPWREFVIGLFGSMKPNSTTSPNRASIVSSSQVGFANVSAAALARAARSGVDGDINFKV